MPKLRLLTAVEQIFHVVPDLATPEQVQASVREILGDPTLELFWWDRDGERYVDVHDGPGELATVDASAPRVATLVEYETRKVGAILHDPRLLERPDFLEAFVPAMRIAMERDRLHRDLLEKIDELKASRLRIVEAADEERRRLERNLHDGAQQRLVVVLLGLHALEKRVRDVAQLQPLVASAREELEGAIEDLRELARGLHPPLLAQQGLEAAVRAGARRSAIPVQLELRLGGSLPAPIEAAAYYVCAEAVTNAIKHVQCSKVSLSLMHEAGILTVEVTDDGVGGAALGEGTASGLYGLRDRVEALDGNLTIESPAGAGTRLVAVFPV
ncbi:MAG: sensor histidine kinase [Gaiellaceae bacterium]